MLFNSRHLSLIRASHAAITGLSYCHHWPFIQPLMLLSLVFHTTLQAAMFVMVSSANSRMVEFKPTG